MAIKCTFQGVDISLPAGSGGKRTCNRCSCITHATAFGPIPTKTEDWRDGFVYWSIFFCFRCGHGEQKNKYVRAAYLKRVGRFSSI